MKSTGSIILAAIAALAMLGAQAPANAKLTCKTVGKSRWQVCADVKPFKKFTAGVGFRFNKSGPGKLAAKTGKQR